MKKIKILFLYALSTVVLCSLCPWAAATSIQMSWGGYLEPLGSDPWGVDGDGDPFTTQTDGTPFLVTITMPLDSTGMSIQDGFGQFDFVTASMTIGGVAASISPGSAYLFFTDDREAPDGSTTDRVGFLGLITYQGVERFMDTNVYLDADTFDLVIDDGIVFFPELASTIAAETVLTFTGSGVFSFTLAGSGFSVTTVPIPAAIYLFSMALTALLGFKR